ncbi:MAG: aminomethyl-transferring glycine dehydrogenase subunit GcvPA [Pirellulales bacterium]
MSSPASVSPFVSRHVGPREHEIRYMLRTLGYSSLDELSAAVIPSSVADNAPLKLQPGVSEEQALEELRTIAKKNRVLRSLIGQGYYGTHTPKVLLRNVLENPAWYTAYTPYQPEISQGRLEVLFYFQTMVCELTGMDICGASLLDEATAAAEAMAMCSRHNKASGTKFLISSLCHPQTIEVVRTRAVPMGLEVVEFNEQNPVKDWSGVFGIMVQYPNSSGAVCDYSQLFQQAHQHKALTIVASDLLALQLLRTPKAMGADVVVGCSQRFGVPLGFGGPHAAFLATVDVYKRSMPGRIVGQSIDSHGKPAYRLALQTREQHIRREKATSNICTAQALLAIMSTLYAMYHGPEGLTSIARRVHTMTRRLADSLRRACFQLASGTFFDTLVIETGNRTTAIHQAALNAGFNLRHVSEDSVGLSLDETVTDAELSTLASVFGASLVDAGDELAILSKCFGWTDS